MTAMIARVTTQAISQLRDAIECDNNEDFEKAFELYKKAIGNMLCAIKREGDQQVIRLLRNKAREALDRAEQLKAHLQNKRIEQE